MLYFPFAKSALSIATQLAGLQSATNWIAPATWSLISAANKNLRWLSALNLCDLKYHVKMLCHLSINKQEYFYSPQNHLKCQFDESLTDFYEWSVDFRLTLWNPS